MGLKASPRPPMFTTPMEGAGKKKRHREDKDLHERSLSAPTLDNFVEPCSGGCPEISGTGDTSFLL